MTSVVNYFQFIFPILVVSTAVILLCFYIHAKKKRAVYDVNAPTPQDNALSVCHTISLPEYEAQEDTAYDRLPPRYSTVDLPPPYSLFEPILTNVWPGGPPPPYEMYPITLPLASHHWLTTTESSPSPSSTNH